MFYWFVELQSIYCIFYLFMQASRLAQLVERETVNLEVVGSIPILRAFCSDEDYFYCRIRAIPFVAQKMPSSHYYYYCLYYTGSLNGLNT